MTASSPAMPAPQIKVALSARTALLLLAAPVLVFIAYPLVSSARVFSLPALQLIFEAQNLEALRNSLLLALLTVVPATAMGVPLAWLCARTDLPGKNLIATLVSISFVVPVLLTSIAYVFLFGRNGGLINQFGVKVLGLQAPLFDVYSFAGVALVSVLHVYPLVFFTTLGGLSKMNPELEEAGRIAGMNPVQVFVRITLGAILPSIMAGVTFVVAEALTVLAAPLLLGSPVQIRFMTTELFGTIVMSPNLPAALALSIPLVTITLVLIGLQRWLMGDVSSSRFAVVAGKGVRSETVQLGRWKWICVALAWLPVVLSFLLPVVTLTAAAFMDRWWKGLDPSNFSLRNFRFLLEDPATLLAVKNSVLLAFGVALSLALIGALLAILLSGEQNWLKRSLRALAAIPLGLPHVVAGVLILLAWYGAPFRLGGSLWILVFGYMFVMIPYSLRTCEAARGQIDGSLGEAAQIVGMTPLQVWRHVMLPLMKNGVSRHS